VRKSKKKTPLWGQCRKAFRRPGVLQRRGGRAARLTGILFPPGEAAGEPAGAAGGQSLERAIRPRPHSSLVMPMDCEAKWAVPQHGPTTANVVVQEKLIYGCGRAAASVSRFSRVCSRSSFRAGLRTTHHPLSRELVVGFERVQDFRQAPGTLFHRLGTAPSKFSTDRHHRSRQFGSSPRSIPSVPPAAWLECKVQVGGRVEGETGLDAAGVQETPQSRWESQN